VQPITPKAVNQLAGYRSKRARIWHSTRARTRLNAAPTGSEKDRESRMSRVVNQKRKKW